MIIKHWADWRGFFSYEKRDENPCPYRVIIIGLYSGKLKIILETTSVYIDSGDLNVKPDMIYPDINIFAIYLVQNNLKTSALLEVLKQKLCLKSQS